MCELPHTYAARIYAGIGANRPHPRFGDPVNTLSSALQVLSQRYPIAVCKLSGWFDSSPVPVSRQGWFTNAVVELDTRLQPDALLGALHEVEATFGRRRKERNESRTIDLDLVDYRGQRHGRPDQPGLVLPHPRAAQRRFVLYPLRDVAPRWRHPITGQGIDELIAGLPADQIVRRLA